MNPGRDCRAPVSREHRVNMNDKDVDKQTGFLQVMLRRTSTL